MDRTRPSSPPNANSTSPYIDHRSPPPPVPSHPIPSYSHHHHPDDSLFHSNRPLSPQSPEVLNPSHDPVLTSRITIPMHNPNHPHPTSPIPHDPQSIYRHFKYNHHIVHDIIYTNDIKSLEMLILALKQRKKALMSPHGFLLHPSLQKPPSDPFTLTPFPSSIYHGNVSQPAWVDFRSKIDKFAEKSKDIIQNEQADSSRHTIPSQSPKEYTIPAIFSSNHMNYDINTGIVHHATSTSSHINNKHLYSHPRDDYKTGNFHDDDLEPVFDPQSPQSYQSGTQNYYFHHKNPGVVQNPYHISSNDASTELNSHWGSTLASDRSGLSHSGTFATSLNISSHRSSTLPPSLLYEALRMGYFASHPEYHSATTQFDCDQIQKKLENLQKTRQKSAQVSSNTYETTSQTPTNSSTTHPDHHPPTPLLLPISPVQPFPTPAISHQSSNSAQIFSHKLSQSTLSQSSQGSVGTNFLSHSPTIASLHSNSSVLPHTGIIQSSSSSSSGKRNCDIHFVNPKHLPKDILSRFTVLFSLVDWCVMNYGIITDLVLFYLIDMATNGFEISDLLIKSVSIKFNEIDRSTNNNTSIDSSLTSLNRATHNTSSHTSEFTQKSEAPDYITSCIIKLDFTTFQTLYFYLVLNYPFQTRNIPTHPTNLYSLTEYAFYSLYSKFSSFYHRAIILDRKYCHNDIVDYDSTRIQARNDLRVKIKSKQKKYDKMTVFEKSTPHGRHLAQYVTQNAMIYSANHYLYSICSFTQKVYCDAMVTIVNPLYHINLAQQHTNGYPELVIAQRPHQSPQSSNTTLSPTQILDFINNPATLHMLYNIMHPKLLKFHQSTPELTIPLWGRSLLQLYCRVLHHTESYYTLLSTLYPPQTVRLKKIQQLKLQKKSQTDNVDKNDKNQVLPCHQHLSNLDSARSSSTSGSAATSSIPFTQESCISFGQPSDFFPIPPANPTTQPSAWSLSQSLPNVLDYNIASMGSEIPSTNTNLLSYMPPPNPHPLCRLSVYNPPSPPSSRTPSTIDQQPLHLPFTFDHSGYQPRELAPILVEPSSFIPVPPLQSLYEFFIFELLVFSNPALRRESDLIEEHSSSQRHHHSSGKSSKKLPLNTEITQNIQKGQQLCDALHPIYFVNPLLHIIIHRYGYEIYSTFISNSEQFEFCTLLISLLLTFYNCMFDETTLATSRVDTLVLRLIRHEFKHLFLHIFSIFPAQFIYQFLLMIMSDSALISTPGHSHPSVASSSKKSEENLNNARPTTATSSGLPKEQSQQKQPKYYYYLQWLIEYHSGIIELQDTPNQHTIYRHRQREILAKKHVQSVQSDKDIDSKIAKNMGKTVTTAEPSYTRLKTTRLSSHGSISRSNEPSYPHFTTFSTPSHRSNDTEQQITPNVPIVQNNHSGQYQPSNGSLSLLSSTSSPDMSPNIVARAMSFKTPIETSKNGKITFDDSFDYKKYKAGAHKTVPSFVVDLISPSLQFSETKNNTPMGRASQPLPTQPANSLTVSTIKEYPPYTYAFDDAMGFYPDNDDSITLLLNNPVISQENVRDNQEGLKKAPFHFQKTPNYVHTVQNDLYDTPSVPPSTTSFSSLGESLSSSISSAQLSFSSTHRSTQHIFPPQVLMESIPNVNTEIGGKDDNYDPQNPKFCLLHVFQQFSSLHEQLPRAFQCNLNDLILLPLLYSDVNIAQWTKLIYLLTILLPFEFGVNHPNIVNDIIISLSPIHYPPEFAENTLSYFLARPDNKTINASESIDTISPLLSSFQCDKDDIGIGLKYCDRNVLQQIYSHLFQSQCIMAIKQHDVHINVTFNHFHKSLPLTFENIALTVADWLFVKVIQSLLVTQPSRSNFETIANTNNFQYNHKLSVKNDKIQRENALKNTNSVFFEYFDFIEHSSLLLSIQTFLQHISISTLFNCMICFTLELSTGFIEEHELHSLNSSNSKINSLPNGPDNICYVHTPHFSHVTTPFLSSAERSNSQRSGSLLTFNTIIQPSTSSKIRQYESVLKWMITMFTSLSCKQSQALLSHNTSITNKLAAHHVPGFHSPLSVHSVAQDGIVPLVLPSSQTSNTNSSFQHNSSAQSHRALEELDGKMQRNTSFSGEESVAHHDDSNIHPSNLPSPHGSSTPQKSVNNSVSDYYDPVVAVSPTLVNGLVKNPHYNNKNDHKNLPNGHFDGSVHNAASFNEIKSPSHPSIPTIITQVQKQDEVAQFTADLHNAAPLHHLAPFLISFTHLMSRKKSLNNVPYESSSPNPSQSLPTTPYDLRSRNSNLILRDNVLLNQQNAPIPTMIKKNPRTSAFLAPLFSHYEPLFLLISLPIPPHIQAFYLAKYYHTHFSIHKNLFSNSPTIPGYTSPNTSYSHSDPITRDEYIDVVISNDPTFQRHKSCLLYYLGVLTTLLINSVKTERAMGLNIANSSSITTSSPLPSIALLSLKNLLDYNPLLTLFAQSTNDTLLSIIHHVGLQPHVVAYILLNPHLLLEFRGIHYNYETGGNDGAQTNYNAEFLSNNEGLLNKATLVVIHQYFVVLLHVMILASLHDPSTSLKDPIPVHQRPQLSCKQNLPFSRSQASRVPQHVASTLISTAPTTPQQSGIPHLMYWFQTLLLPRLDALYQFYKQRADHQKLKSKASNETYDENFNDYTIIISIITAKLNEVINYMQSNINRANANKRHNKNITTNLFHHTNNPIGVFLLQNGSNSGNTPYHQPNYAQNVAINNQTPNDNMYNDDMNGLGLLFDMENLKMVALEEYYYVFTLTSHYHSGKDGLGNKEYLKSAQYAQDKAYQDFVIKKIFYSASEFADLTTKTVDMSRKHIQPSPKVRPSPQEHPEHSHQQQQPLSLHPPNLQPLASSASVVSQYPNNIHLSAYNTNTVPRSSSSLLFGSQRASQLQPYRPNQIHHLSQSFHQPPQQYHSQQSQQPHSSQQQPSLPPHRQPPQSHLQHHSRQPPQQLFPGQQLHTTRTSTSIDPRHATNLFQQQNYRQNQHHSDVHNSQPPQNSNIPGHQRSRG